EALGGLGGATSDVRLKAVTTARAAVLASVTSGEAGPHVAAAVELPVEGADRGALALALDLLDDDPRVLATRLEQARAAERSGLRLERVEALLARGRLAEAADEVHRGLADDPGD